MEHRETKFQDPFEAGRSFLLFGVILGNDEIKLFETESFIRLSLMSDKTCVHQIEKSLIVHVFTDCTGDLLQLLESDVTLFLGVIKGKYSLEAVFCLVFADP